jgi:hypothetical protein
MLLLMTNVKWDVKEIMSQHNIYVDALLKASALGNSLLKTILPREVFLFCNGSKMVTTIMSSGGVLKFPKWNRLTV